MPPNLQWLFHGTMETRYGISDSCILSMSVGAGGSTSVDLAAWDEHTGSVTKTTGRIEGNAEGSRGHTGRSLIRRVRLLSEVE